MVFGTTTIRDNASIVTPLFTRNPPPPRLDACTGHAADINFPYATVFAVSFATRDPDKSLSLVHDAKNHSFYWRSADKYSFQFRYMTLKSGIAYWNGVPRYASPKIHCYCTNLINFYLNRLYIYYAHHE